MVGYLGPTLVLYPNDISGNGDNGVFCRANCTLQISGATITGNGDIIWRPKYGYTVTHVLGLVC